MADDLSTPIPAIPAGAQDELKSQEASAAADNELYTTDPRSFKEKYPLQYRVRKAHDFITNAVKQVAMHDQPDSTKQLMEKPLGQVVDAAGNLLPSGQIYGGMYETTLSRGLDPEEIEAIGGRTLSGLEPDFIKSVGGRTMKIGTKPYDEQKFKTELPVKVSWPEHNDFIIDKVKGLNQGHAMARAKANWPGAVIEPSTQEEFDAFNPKATPQATVAAGGSGALSSEEIARPETFVKYGKTGAATHLGKQPDATLKPGEAILAINNRTGQVRVQNTEGLSDSEALRRFEAPIKRDFGPTQQQKVINEVGDVQSKAKIQLAERGGRVRVKDLSSAEPGKGHASNLLSRLTDSADKHGVTLELTSSPYGDEKTRLDHDQLKSFYQRHGFVDEPGFDPSLGYMIREPKN